MEFYKRLFFTINLRYALKVGVASFLAYAVSTICGLDYSAWAVVSSVISLQMNVAESMQIGLNRIFGTFIGAFVGVILLVFVPHDPYLVGLGVFAFTSFFGFIKPLHGCFATAAIACSIVFLSGLALSQHSHSLAITFGLMRTGEIVIGVVSAFVVSFLMWPVRLVDTLQTDIGLQFNETARLLKGIIHGYLTEQEHISSKPLTALSERIWSNQTRFIKARKHESIFLMRVHALMTVQIHTLNRSVEYLKMLQEAINDYVEERDGIWLHDELENLAASIAEGLTVLGGSRAAEPHPEVVYKVTLGVDRIERRILQLKKGSPETDTDLHQFLQVFTVCQLLRMLSEALLIALDRAARAASKNIV